MPADRRLFDSSSMTPPPAPRADAVTNTVSDDEIIFITKGVDVAHGYDPTLDEPVLNREYLQTMFRRFLDEQGDAIVEEARRRLEEVEWEPLRIRPWLLKERG